MNPLTLLLGPRPVRILLGAVLVGAASLGALQELAALAVQRGDQARAARDWTGAEDAYGEAIARAPWDVTARDRLAATRFEAGDDAGARDAYRLAAAFGGWTPARHVGLGLVLERLGETDAALAEYEAARALDPYDVQALQAASPLYWQRQQWIEAEIAYGTLLVAAPDLLPDAALQAHYRYALLVFSSAPDAARQHLRRIQPDPGYARAVGALLQALDEAAALDNPAFRAGRLGVGLVEAEEYTLAGRQFQQAIELDPSYGEAYAYIGLCQDRLGEDGTIFINRGLLLAPHSPLAHMIAGYHWRARRQWTAAREEFERAYNLDRRNAAAAAEMGAMFVYEGQFGAAEVRLKEATELAPGEPRFWVLLAQFYLDSVPNAQAAASAAERAGTLAPNDPLVIDTLAWARLQAGRIDGDTALSMLERAYAADPRQASTAYHLGMLYLARGQTQAAQTALSRAQALDPDGGYGARAAQALAQLGR